MDPIWVAGAATGAWLAPKLWRRIKLSRAKHRSLTGHPRTAVLLSRLVPQVTYDESFAFGVDGAPNEVAAKRREAFLRIAQSLRARAPKTLEASQSLESGVSDVAFVNAYRVPFQFRELVRRHLQVGSIVAETDGPRVADLDGNWAYDLGGSYGVNLFGIEVYKKCIDRAVERARDLGPILGAYHPVIADNVDRLKKISGKDEVSFHMSGTEAVMQAVRLARYHTGRPKAVRFAGAYHGWSDNLQAGVGNPRPVRDLFTLQEMSERTLNLLATRNDIACVLVNPLQAMTPNGPPSGDSTLLASDRKARYDKAAYADWLRRLREVCTKKGIVLILDEVFLGFRLARGGVQEYFGVDADIVTYGKTLGGGLPVGVVCGKRAFMKRYKDDKPADICFARGTFNSHPYVMAAMNEFLRFLDEPETQATYDGLEERWNDRAVKLNAKLEAMGAPVHLENMVSVWTTLYTKPSAYNWMFQYYLREQGLALSWIGTGRMIFSHDLTDADFEQIGQRYLAAAAAMKEDGWWWADAELTNKLLKRRVLKELIRAKLGRSSDRDAHPAAGEAAPHGTA
ncbi:MAG: aminotransferase class III-fold pyridoxal phosphate-dependent enzyme [Deltaproteobacteria bacterium]|jgi:glutamate-1-semialdehyde 2,1-aminomutase